jgi:hypothetical protein
MAPIKTAKPTVTSASLGRFIGNISAREAKNKNRKKDVLFRKISLFKDKYKIIIAAVITTIKYII